MSVISNTKSTFCVDLQVPSDMNQQGKANVRRTRTLGLCSRLKTMHPRSSLQFKKQNLQLFFRISSTWIKTSGCVIWGEKLIKVIVKVRPSSERQDVSVNTLLYFIREKRWQRQTYWGRVNDINVDITRFEGKSGKTRTIQTERTSWKNKLKNKFEYSQYNSH